MGGPQRAYRARVRGGSGSAAHRGSQNNHSPTGAYRCARRAGWRFLPRDRPDRFRRVAPGSRGARTVSVSLTRFGGAARRGFSVYGSSNAFTAAAGGSTMVEPMPVMRVLHCTIDQAVFLVLLLGKPIASTR